MRERSTGANTDSRKSIGGLSERTHAKFNALKYMNSLPNADRLLSDMIYSYEFIGALRNPSIVRVLKKYREDYRTDAEMILAMVDALEAQRNIKMSKSDRLESNSVDENSDETNK